MGGQIRELLAEIKKTKGIEPDYVLDGIKDALASVSRKKVGDSADVIVRIDEDTDSVKIFTRKFIVAEPENEITEISLEEARLINPEYNFGDAVEIENTPKNFSRTAAQIVKQTILQSIREAERQKLHEKFSRYINNDVPAVVRKISGKNVLLELLDTETFLLPGEQVAIDEYAVGRRYKVYVTDVASTPRGPNIIVSRSSPELIKKMFEIEIPEIKNGTVVVKGVAREAGNRSKVAVYSYDANVDAIGTCIGARGFRVRPILDEIGGEKIDIVRYDDDPAEYAAQALRPADVIYSEVDESGKMCKIKVDKNQLSLAIGKEGQNVRLAARLTGLKIDISADE
jgi:N utilization substance protein A